MIYLHPVLIQQFYTAVRDIDTFKRPLLVRKAFVQYEEHFADLNVEYEERIAELEDEHEEGIADLQEEDERLQASRDDLQRQPYHPR